MSFFCFSEPTSFSKVYLRNLPPLAARSLTSSTTFGRASSSFTSGPWIHSYTQLQATALASSSTLPDTAQNATSPVSASLKEPSKVNSRYLFTDNELESLTRNAEEILQLHEHFVRELRVILEPLGFTMEMNENDLGHEHLANLNAAIRAVSTKFATEVRFIYLWTKIVEAYHHLNTINSRLRVSMHISRSAQAMRKPWISCGKLTYNFR